MRYKQTVIGVAWALIRLFLTMVVFTVIFGRLAKLPSEGDAPYAVLVFGAMLPWQFFSTALSSCSGGDFQERCQSWAAVDAACINGSIFARSRSSGG